MRRKDNMNASVLLDGLTQVSVVTWIMCITLSVLVLRLYTSNRASSPPLPPSPRFWLPVLGHLLLLNPDLRITFGKFRKQFGDVYGFYMGSKYAVVIGGYETLKEAFKTRSLFVNRPYKYLYEVTLNKGFISVNGDIWRDHRRFAFSTLKDFGLGRNVLQHTIQMEAKRLLESLKMEVEKPFDPKELFSTVIANVINSMIFGGTFRYGDPKFKKLLDRFTAVNKASNRIGISMALPFLAKLPGDPLQTKQIARDVEARYAFIREIIDDRLDNYDENVIEDFTSAFIKEMRQKQLRDEQTHFTLDQLSGVISDLIVGATETTTTTLRWCLVCLIGFPETQERMYDVINAHIGADRPPALEDRKTIPYVDAFIMEAMRFCEMGIASLLYSPSVDVELNGYKIPKGAIIIPDLDSVLSDPHIWGDPENFRPERFLNKDGSIRTREEFIPFFIGKRRCIGEAMARMELFLFLSAMVQNFYFESPDGEEVSVLAVDGVFGVAHEPKSFRVIARARHAY